MSTLRTDVLQTTDSSYSINVADIFNGTALASTSPTGGASMIGNSIQVATSLTQFRTFLKTQPSKSVWLNGVGLYVLDPIDVTSVEDVGTVIVATDGGRWKRNVSHYLFAKDFGALGDGVNNDTAALNKALEACKIQGKTLFLSTGVYMVTESSGGSGYALFNRGVSMVGENTLAAIIRPLPSMPNTADFLRIKPDNNAGIDFLELGNFAIWPTNGVTKYGKRAVMMDFSQLTNVGELYMHHMYLFPGNDYSLEIANSIVVNPQGVPSNSTIERNNFWEGTKCIGIGDSCKFRDNVYRSTAGSGRIGSWIYNVDGGGGVASHTILEANNYDCDGGAIFVPRARNIKVLYNNIEQSAGAGTGSNAVVDIDGSSGTIAFAEVKGNHIGIFGTATAGNAIRIHGALGAHVDQNTILAGFTVAQAILITASASDTVLGVNEISSTFTNPVLDLGTATRGASKAVSLGSGITNTGGYQPLEVLKSMTGSVNLSGVVSHAGLVSGAVIGTIPTGFRPATVQRFSVSNVVAGNVSFGSVEVAPSGTITYFGATATRVEINTNFKTIGYIIGSL